MVFQEYAFPWMTVAANISFGLEIKKIPKARLLKSRPARKTSAQGISDRFLKISPA